MASIEGKRTLFFVTSPRSPLKMVDEIRLLVEHHEGQEWTESTQTEFAKELVASDSFEGYGSATLSDFSARDRIGRGPKSLGLLDLKPVIRLTPAGRAFIDGEHPRQAFLRQLMKFQLPSPYHVDPSGAFCVRPYLELLRMTHDLGGLSKHEIALFFMQLTDFSEYDTIMSKIAAFRLARQNGTRSESWRTRVDTLALSEMARLYQDQVAAGNFHTRQSPTSGPEQFLRKKWRNQVDYADAAMRYLRATELVAVEHSTYRIVIASGRESEVDYILRTVPRAPVTMSESEYKDYLFDDTRPSLLVDSRAFLVESIRHMSHGEVADGSLDALDDIQLRRLWDETLDAKRDAELERQMQRLSLLEEVGDVQSTFQDIISRSALDIPLTMEWNVWRAMAALDRGRIRGNFVMDTNGEPISTASGGKPDIVCEYGAFDLVVEVTTSFGMRQFEAEHESVPRHIGDHARSSGRDTYGLFVAVRLTPATIAYFYTLRSQYVDLYGGHCRILPIGLDDFVSLFDRVVAARNRPGAADIRRLVEETTDLALQPSGEGVWYRQVRELLKRWPDRQPRPDA